MLVFYLAAIDSDESKNKFEYIYRKYYRFMLRTASSIIRDKDVVGWRLQVAVCLHIRAAVQGVGFFKVVL